jgi:hypothetical protein
MQKVRLRLVQQSHNEKIVIYEPSAGRHFSRMSALLFKARAMRKRVFHIF